jgi:BirA family biotin operon repressor/biotin-[acetyl-CoA-carboxylase] ligase
MERMTGQGMSVHDLSPEYLAEVLPQRTIYFHAQTDSTNTEALRLLRTGAPDGTVVVADMQTAGRGRLDRRWHSPAGSALMFSVLLRIKQGYSDIGMMASLAVVEALETFGVPGLGIKWPNDVQIDGRKVCGVLPEAEWSGTTAMGVVIGIGINVRVDFAGSSLEQTAANAEAPDRPIDRTRLLAAVLARLDHWTPHLTTQAVFDAWRARLNMLGRVVRIQQGDGRVSGTALRVERDGALILRGEEGELRVIAGDIAIGKPLPNGS